MKRHTIISRVILSIFTLINLSTIPPAMLVSNGLYNYNIFYHFSQTTEHYLMVTHPYKEVNQFLCVTGVVGATTKQSFVELRRVPSTLAASIP